MPAVAKKKFKPDLFLFLGLVLLVFGVFIFSRIFYPIAKAEIKYRLSPALPPTTPTPADPEFSLYIPKINVNVRVIPNIDPNNSQIYQIVLTQGVAHALGSAFPGQDGNVFIFAHSATDWFQANDYNAVFYLLNKMQKNDEITVYYHQIPHIYSVESIKVVNKQDISYLSNDVDSHQLTLMTCWPPGTNLKRLVLTAISKDQ